jgi:hypothetical protein
MREAAVALLMQTAALYRIPTVLQVDCPAALVELAPSCWSIHQSVSRCATAYHAFRHVMYFSCSSTLTRSTCLTCCLQIEANMRTVAKGAITPSATQNANFMSIQCDSSEIYELCLVKQLMKSLDRRAQAELMTMPTPAQKMLQSLETTAAADYHIGDVRLLRRVAVPVVLAWVNGN